MSDAIESTFYPEPRDLSRAPLAEGDGVTSCTECGFDFGKKLTNRRARGLGVCLSCAEALDATLDPQDMDDLAEDYWSRRYDA